MKKTKSEYEFENEVIEYLTNIGGTSQWEYVESIKSIDGLWDNFKSILERNNRSRLKNKPLTDNEFRQVKKVISDLNTPYEAGKFLYGVNGISEVVITPDDDPNKTIFLSVFDQKEVGAGDNVYQIVNQIEKPNVIVGKQNRRFDVTLLINGLPIIQIELKKEMHPAEESLNQMQQYISEKQFSGIFSTVQILIAMTPYEIKYMANTTLKQFNKDFAFEWQDEKSSSPIRSWKKFADKVLSIPMAHEMSTRYMILDGTQNKESIKVMRPYQVYATKRVLEKVKKYDFNHDDSRLGYVWHTTGSGKTITSFKTAWLASREPNVDKVVFLVDRIALTNQTVDAYKAYDPTSDVNGLTGVISDTANVSDLQRKLTKKSDSNIIVTSIQKMARFVSRKSFKVPNHRILFIVDEAHRSTGNGTDSAGMLSSIKRAIPTAAWVGYTGTPKFEADETYKVFGDSLHEYTIKEAIADRNVLGFKVEFKETIQPPVDPTEEEYSQGIKGSVYDESHEHVELVVDDILKNWNSRSCDRKYNALFTVRVGGIKASTPRVMEYFRAFKEKQSNLKENEKIKIAVSFSQDTSNGNNQLETNEGLHEAIIDYNQMFNTNFDMSTVKQYTNDLASRLNKSAVDGMYLDLVIVIDQLLTGFDAPELNTLYVDRSLNDSGLIQAYSRTNRVHDFDTKPYGNVVNYRWPKENEESMNLALNKYSNRVTPKGEEASKDSRKDNMDSGITARPYSDVSNQMKNLVLEIRELTAGYNNVPASEKQQEELYQKIKEYNSTLNKLKQYPYDEKSQTGYPRNEDDFIDEIGITEEEVIMMQTVIVKELKKRIAKNHKIDISQIDLKLTHIHDVTINYDYLSELIARMANEVNANEMAKAAKTKDDIYIEAGKTEVESERKKYIDFTNMIYDKKFIFDDYPVSSNKSFINEQMTNALNNSVGILIRDFMSKWGLNYKANILDFKELIKTHQYGVNDLDKKGELNNLINSAKDGYKECASKEIAELSWIKYRNNVRAAIYQFADILKENE